MQLRKMALIAGLLGLASCTDGELVAPESIQAAKGGKPGKPGGGDGGGGSYTLIDLGTDFGLHDINDGGVLVGSFDGRAAVWQDIQVNPVPLLLPDPVGTGALAFRINAQGTRVIGFHWNVAQTVEHTVLWEIDLEMGSAMPSIPLDPLDGDEEAEGYGVNDLGQVVGQSFVISGPWEGHSPVLWDPNGSGGMVGRDLGDLLGHPGAWAHGLNNAGHVVGRSGIGKGADGGRAVLWIVEGGNATILDLTLGSDGTGDNFALEITEPSGGLVKISGYTSVAGEVRPTVWTVDVQNRVVTDDVRLEEGGAGGGNDINVNGDKVAINWGAVWTLATNSVESLPTLSNRCRSNARRINNSGTVIGSSWGRVRGRCVKHAVLWTKNN